MSGREEVQKERERVPIFQDRQYGIKKRNGAAELARDVTRAMHAHPMYCVIQVDIANAFGSIQREEVHRSIEQIGHPVGHLASKWLWSEHTAAVALPGRELRHITSTVGVPQGDPLSALVFSLAYSGLVQKGLDHHVLGRHDVQDDMSDQVQSWAYIDDLTLMCDPGEAGAVLAALEHSLASGGLMLNRRKTQIYLPMGAPHPDQEAWRGLWKENGSSEGIVLVGHPAEAEMPYFREAVPIGKRSFVEAYPEKRYMHQQSLAENLVNLALTSDPADGILQVSWILLRQMWNSADTHLHRAIDFRHQQPTLQRKARHIAEITSRLMALDPLTESQTQLLYLDARHSCHCASNSGVATPQSQSAI